MKKKTFKILYKVLNPNFSDCFMEITIKASSREQAIKVLEEKWLPDKIKIIRIEEVEETLELKE